ncbi:MAG: DUF3343 domain-containing protein [Clostridia bacterium]|nr:DUF3343 domain-containing protein [Clostridia bacterium]
MIYCIAVLKSRTMVYELADALSYGGLQYSIINTPTRAHIGCGLSIKFSCPYKSRVEEICFNRGLSGHVAFYRVENRGLSMSVTRI